MHFREGKKYSKEDKTVINIYIWIVTAVELPTFFNELCIKLVFEG